MARRRSAPRPRKTERRWHIPPPLTHGPETLEGGSVLREFPGELGVVLWQALRDVRLWSETPPAERERLFAPAARERRMAALLAAGMEPEVGEALERLAEVVGEPGDARADAVALACRRIAQWAESRGKLAAALDFAQNAALVLPADASMAYAVGVLARRAADHARAEVWLRRAIGLARRSREWRLYSQSFLGLGRMAKERGNYPAARYHWTRALRGARRGGMRQEQAWALHNLCVIAIETGRTADADRLARAAFEKYGPSHPKIPTLAHDIAYGWMEQGRFARALEVFRAALPHLAPRLDAVFGWANLARAAAGCGNEELFLQGWNQVLERLRDPSATEGEARALVELSRGAAHLGDWRRAADAAERALAAATERGECQVRFAAESVLEQVRRRERVQARDPEAPPEAVEAGDALASELVRSLAVAAGGTA